MPSSQVKRSRRRSSAVAGSIALVLVFTSARGAATPRPTYERADHVPPLPSPFVLPELSHPGLRARIDLRVGRLSSSDRGGLVGGPSNAIVSSSSVSVEANVLVPARLFVGLLYPFASALPPDGGLAPGKGGRPAGQQLMSGNLEGHVRAVFPLPTSLEIGFGLAATAPTASTDRDRGGRSASLAASSLDPTNVAFFLPGQVALRPFGDLRILRGRLVLQGRHGLDVLIDGAGREAAQVAGRLAAHVGYRVTDDLEVSMEATQYYFFASQEKVDGAQGGEQAFAEKYRITDARRSVFTVGPGLRYATPEIDVGASIMTNIGEALTPAATDFIGVCVSVVGRIAGRTDTK